MSGHSKWSTIKHQKGVADARRGQIFTKLTREIIVAAREGGPDPATNARLRLAVQKAKDNSMPNENIERAIKRAAGGAEGVSLAEVTYEGYGPGGTAILVQGLTDNRNRTLSEVRNIFARGGGSLGDHGCVAWLFQAKGVLVAQGGGHDPEEVGLLAIDAGAEDVKVEGEVVEIITSPSDLEAVRRALEAKGIPIASSEVSMLPKTTVEVSAEAEALKALKFLERLEEMDEVQQVFTNADFPNEVLEKFKG